MNSIKLFYNDRESYDEDFKREYYLESFGMTEDEVVEFFSQTESARKRVRVNVVKQLESIKREYEIRR